MGVSRAEGGAYGDVWGSVTQQLGGGEGSSSQRCGGPGVLVGATEAGSRPCTWAGGLENGVGLPQDP